MAARPAVLRHNLIHTPQFKTRTETPSRYKKVSEARKAPLGAKKLKRLALHLYKTGFGGEVSVAGAFEFAAFLYGLRAEDFTKQVVAGFPFA